MDALNSGGEYGSKENNKIKSKRAKHTGSSEYNDSYSHGDLLDNDEELALQLLRR